MKAKRLLMIAISGSIGFVTLLATVFYLHDSRDLSAFAKLPLTALLAFRREHGSDPVDFSNIKPYLDQLTHADCRIALETEDEYRIIMPISSDRSIVVDIQYERGSGIYVEKYNVRACDYIRD